MSGLSLSEVFQAELHAKKESLRRIAHALGIYVSEKQIEAAAEKRMHAAMGVLLRAKAEGREP